MGVGSRFPHPFFTVGHSARSVAQLAGLLHDAGAACVVDVRAYPRSRANPQFNIDVAPGSFAAHGLRYVHVEALGGRRPKGLGPESPNGWWSNGSFRNYADYALTDGFRAGFGELLGLGQGEPCALMCSEAVWWRCHRRIITDYLLSAGAEVRHVLAPGSIRPAAPTPAAVRAGDGLLHYPAPRNDDAAGE